MLNIIKRLYFIYLIVKVLNLIINLTSLNLN